MSCDQCLGLEQVFGDRVARADLRRYRRRGPSRTTRLLIDALLNEGVHGSTVLDVGGGVGAITFALLANGAASATLVDASEGYLAAARTEARRQGLEQRISLRHGDFVEIAPSLEPAQVVTLDKVICCYHDVRSLIDASARTSLDLYALVYPRDAWWSRGGSRLANFVLSITRSHYRTFIHPQKLVERLIEDHGLRRVFHRRAGMWQVAVYRRAER